MLDKAYDPKPVEAKWLERFSGRSEPEGGRSGRFVVVIPPPNVTGALHLGHALNNTLQDVLVRWKRSAGANACWVPGTDHGGIATQNVMEKQLKAEGKTRHELGRDAFLDRMQAWTRDCKKTILGQLRKLGCSLDWEREAFTMDEARAEAVYEAFKRLWDKGLVYRGERLVNWCVRCGTALSDIEVEREERKGALYHIHYPLEGGGEGAVVATTRPITMFGDTAVAVNPKDARWTHLIGKKVVIPLIDRAVPVIADDYVDFEFGTGCLKVTPAHDQNDWEIGQRHGLPAIKAISPDGKLTEAAGRFAGLSREKAQDEILKELELRKKEEHKSAVQTCYRCGSVIEPLLSLQWFVKQTELARPALKALDEGRFVVHPENWAKPYRDWLVNIKDWCVSRQIWWGHRIPVWYKDGEKPVVSKTSPGPGWTQDPDVLDTWFSSALWPISVFGWPDRTKDLAYYYPTQVLVTGYEILYLWVARMQMMGLEFMGEVPFKDALIHGIVRDKSGKKMSKSLGNVIDPLVMMEKFGTDALRFSLLLQAHPGRDIPFAEESIVGSRNFVNKLWNSTRFVLMRLEPAKKYSVGVPTALADRWILAEYEAMLRAVDEKMSRYEVAGAADALYGFLWDKFCDWYIELTKAREDEAAKAILVNVLAGTLEKLQAFCPFVCSELLEALAPHRGGMRPAADDAAVQKMGRLMEAVTAIRSLRSQLNVPPGSKLRVVASTLEGFEPEYLKALARIETLETGSRPDKSATAVAAGASFFVPLEGVVDFAQERKRLEKEAEKARAEVVKISQKVDNPNFRSRAPKEEVELALSQKAAAADRLAKLEETLKILS